MEQLWSMHTDAPFKLYETDKDSQLQRLVISVRPIDCKWEVSPHTQQPLYSSFSLQCVGMEKM